MFELCLALRIRHPDDLVALYSASELNDWWDYYQVEPWGETRQDGRASWQVDLIGSLFDRQPLNSACAVPGFVSSIYGPPEMDEETKKQLRRIRVNRRHNIDQT